MDDFSPASPHDIAVPRLAFRRSRALASLARADALMIRFPLHEARPSLLSTKATISPPGVARPAMQDNSH